MNPGEGGRREEGGGGWRQDYKKNSAPSGTHSSYMKPYTK